MGEGACFIGANDGRGAEGLYRGKPPDERMMTNHLAHAQREADGHDSGQPFGDGGDGEADRDDEHIQRVVAAHPSDEEDDGADDERSPSEGFP